MTFDPVADTIGRLSPRLVASKDRIRQLAERELSSQHDAHQIGLALANEFPEIEAIAAGAGTGAIVAAAPDLVEFVQRTPTLSLALGSVFPQYGGEQAERIVLFVADPLVDSDGEALVEDGRWYIPWLDVERRLWRSIDRSGRRVELSVVQATRANVAQHLPGARVALLLCHGSPGVVHLERGVWAETDDVTAADLAELVGHSPPEVMALLCCHASDTAAALRAAGVGSTVAIDTAEALRLADAVELAESFVQQWVNGVPAAVALRSAVGALANSSLAIDARGPTASSRAPRGRAEASELDFAHSPKRWFVGQEVELSQVLRHLDDGGPVAIVGAPGSGKTELARAALARLRLSVPEGVEPWFVSLEGVSSPQGLLERLQAVACGLLGDGADLAALADACDATRQILVLDNAEDLTANPDGTAALRVFVSRASRRRRSQIIITTRDEGPLTDIDALSWVRPRLLSEGETLALMVKAAAASNSQALSNVARVSIDDPDLVGLLAVVGGHPLTAKIVGSRLAADPPGMVLAQLLDGNTAEHGDEGERQRNLRVSVGLSLQRLNAQQLELWQSVAWLAVGLPADLKVDQTTADGLRVLIQMNLLDDEGDLRRVLPSLRRLAVEQPQTTDLLDHLYDWTITSAHAAAKKLGREGARAGLAWWARWWPQVDQLLLFQGWDLRRGELFVVATSFAAYTDMTALPRRWWDVQNLAVVGPAGRSRAEKSLGEMAMREARVGEARAHLERARDFGRDAGDLVAELNAEQWLGQLAMYESRLGAARSHFERARALASVTDSRLAKQNSERSLGDLALRESRLVDARMHLERAREVGRELGDSLGESNAERSLGDLALRESRWEDAHRHLTRALALSSEIGNRLGEMNAEFSLGDLELQRDRLSSARTHLERARDLGREVGDRLGESNAELLLGRLAWREGRLDEARALLVRAGEVAREIGSGVGEANAERALGQVAASEGRLVDARAHLERARDLGREVGDRLGELNAVNSLGRLAVREGQPALAREHLEYALALGQEIGDRLGEVQTEQALGQLATLEDRPDEARAHLERARDLGREVGDRLAEVNAAQYLGDLAMWANRYEDAVDQFEAAAAAATSLSTPAQLVLALWRLSDALDALGREEAAVKAGAQAMGIALSSGMPDLAGQVAFQGLVQRLDSLLNEDDPRPNILTLAGAVLLSDAGVQLPNELADAVTRLRADGNDRAAVDDASQVLADLLGHSPQESTEV